MKSSHFQGTKIAEIAPRSTPDGMWNKTEMICSFYKIFTTSQLHFVLVKISLIPACPSIANTKLTATRKRFDLFCSSKQLPRHPLSECHLAPQALRREKEERGKQKLCDAWASGVRSVMTFCFSALVSFFAKFCFCFALRSSIFCWKIYTKWEKISFV